MQTVTSDVAAWLKADDRSRLPRWESPGRWRDWTDEVINGGLAGIVQERAACLGAALPPECAGRLHRACVVAAANNLHLLAELENLLIAFNRRGIPVMLLKGAALGSVYGRPDLRPMSDVDVLVRPGHLDAALRLLDEQGCGRGRDLVGGDFFPTFHYETEVFTRSARPARVDLHVRPFRPMRVSRTMPDNALWERAGNAVIGRGEAAVPCPEFMLLHLAVHAAFHGFSRILWLYDIKRFTEMHGASMDWDLLTERAASWRLTLPLLRALEETRRQLDVPGLCGVIEGLSSRPVTWADRLTLAQAPRDAAHPMEHVLVNLLGTPGVRFRLRYLRALLRSSRRHLAGLYPYRHPGWTGCAQAWRAARAGSRLFAALGGGAARAIRRLLPGPAEVRRRPTTTLTPQA